MESIPRKRCVACGEEKAASDFYVVDPVTGRLSSRCRPCRIAQAGEYKRNHQDKNRVWSRQYHERNRERERANYSSAKRAQRYAVERKESIEAVRRWRKENRSLKLAQKQRRRARIKSNGGSFSGAEWDALKAAQQYTCLRCKQQEPAIQLVPDHIIPISKGGTSNIDNIQGLCVACNQWKRAKTVDFR